MIVPYILRYNFGEGETGEVEYTNWSDSGKAVHSPKLDEFLTIAGVWRHKAIKFTDNILPEIHRRIVHEDIHFKFLMKDGWIDNLWKPQEDQEKEGLYKEEGWENYEQSAQDNLDTPWDTSDEEVGEEKESEEFDWD
jgi:hypothetical protein